MRKFYPERSKDNVYVEVEFSGSKNRNFIAAGVLIREEQDSLRVAFTAANDKIVDYLDIPVQSIKSIKEIKKLTRIQ